MQLPPPTGETFLANALEKARTAARATGLPAIADDSGIEAAALGGAPGVRSARFAGEDATDEENLAKLLRDAPTGSDARVRVRARARGARRRRRACGRGSLHRHARGEPRGDGGFGYDPAFEPDDIRTAARWRSSPPSRRTRSATADAPPEHCSPCCKTDRMAGPLIAGSVARRGTVKTRAAALSIASNSILIVLKLVAGAITGSARSSPRRCTRRST